MDITRHFFFNLSLLFILLFLVWVLFEKARKAMFSKFYTLVLLVFSLWICIHFSYNPDSSIRYDLRIIPLVIGGLYLEVGPILSVMVIVIRSFYGINNGFYESFLLSLPLIFLFWRIPPWFARQIPQRRIFLAVFLGMVLGILTFTGLEIFNPPIFWFDALFAYLVIPPLGILITSYAIEFIRKNREMKHQLIKAEKLQAVEQMGAAISHEIRNPLTAAIGFVQLLQDDYLPRKKQKDYLFLVKDELKAAERVIQDYLTFAKPSLEMIEELNVKNELKQVLSILQPIANQNSVEIITEYSLLGSIAGDKQKFRQCFINVLKNSVESMPTGGYLTVTTEYHPNQISIIVKDTGMGMTKEQLGRLGEPYYSTKGSKGTGLGMMVVYSIVRAMEGSIKVESAVGKGTIFVFKFPAFKHADESK